MKKMFASFKIIPLLAALVGLSLASFSAQAQSVGNVAAGEKKAAMCIGCHGIVGYQASFPQVHKVPMISGQNAKYIEASLAAYQKGERKHPTMQSIAASLTEQDMADLSAFYEQHGTGAVVASAKPSVEPSVAVAALLQKGACVSCHGDNFSKPISAAYPKLAGQHADYLYVALRSYQTTGNAKVGRANAVMAGQAQMFNKDELKALAQYLGSLQGELQVVPQSRFRSKP
jgi:cytochrome c553